MPSHHPKIAAFWKWFQSQNAHLLAMSGTSDAAWDDALTQLKRIDSRLWFEVSEVVNGKREWIFTAEGRRELFPIVEALVAAAPSLPAWKFVALKPAEGFDFITEYEGIRLDPKTLWFLPMSAASQPTMLGLRVGIPDLDPSHERQATNGVLIILDTALGERESSTAIQHVEVVALPPNPAEHGYIELPELPDYLAWRKKRNSGS